MKYISIVNNGELDIKALILLGASSKREETDKIGRYGSGNKFAIATIMRCGSMRVFSGEKEIVIDTVEEPFREKPFHVIRIGGERTSITTEFGPDWEFWQAIRELYANAIDEGGEILRISDEPIAPVAGKTTIHVWCRDENIVANFGANFDKYFSTKRTPIFKTHYGQIFDKYEKQMSVYRRGIRCIADPVPMRGVYDYDFAEVDINESRLAVHTYRLVQSVWTLMLMSDVKIFKRFLTTLLEHEYFERDYPDYYPSPYTSSVSTEIASFIQENYFAPYSEWSQMDDSEREQYYWLPTNVFKALNRYIDSAKTPFHKKNNSRAGRWKACTMTPLQEAILRKATSFLKEVGFIIPYPIECVEFYSTHTMGSVDEDNKKILLSASWIEKGTHETVNTIIEEYIHLRYNVGDQTRGFQTAVINEFITYMMQKNAITL